MGLVLLLFSVVLTADDTQPSSGIYLVRASSSFTIGKLTWTEFVLSPFFTALEVIAVVLSAQLIVLVVSRSSNFSPGPVTKKSSAAFSRTKHWLKRISRYNKPAIDMRRTWTTRRADQEFPTDQADFPKNPFMALVPMIANLGPTALVNMVLSDRPTLRLPFDIPGPLRRLFQYGLPQTMEPDHRVMSALGLYFLLNCCSSVIAAMVPLVPKRKALYGPRNNYQNYSDLFLSEKHAWELETAEDELLAKIDAELAE
jgi:hypothetical protein